MKKKPQAPAAYDICDCNHEAMLHVNKAKRCFFNVPVGHQMYRGGMKIGIETEPCKCKKFKFNQKLTADPKPTVHGDD